jgi:hypothetical protein
MWFTTTFAAVGILTLIGIVVALVGLPKLIASAPVNVMTTR